MINMIIARTRFLLKHTTYSRSSRLEMPGLPPPPPPLTFRSSHNVVVTLNPRSPQEDEPRSAECDRERTAPWLPFDSEVCERRPDSDPEGDGECFS